MNVVLVNANLSGEHLKAYLDIQRQAAINLYPPNHQFDQVREDFRDGHAYFIDYDGERVAVAHYARENAERVCLNELAIIRPFRRLHVGTETMEILFEEIGPESRIDARFPKNARGVLEPDAAAMISIAFFTSLGFQMDDGDHRRRPRTEPDIVKMSKLRATVAA